MQFVARFDSSAVNAAVARMDEAASARFRTRLAVGLRRVGRDVRNEVIPALEQATGLTRGTIPRAVHEHVAGLSYSLTTRGGDISLRYFGAQEQGGGVSAAPRGVRTSFAGAWIRSGRGAGRRAVDKLNGHVYRNVSGGAWGGKIERVRSGVVIPREMVAGRTKVAFERAVASRLPVEVARMLTTIRLH